MHMKSRSIAALGAIALAVIGVTACGSGTSGEIVAQVAGVGSITKASLDHWLPVEAVVLYQEQPTAPVPKGVIPDPPSYNACIAYLKATPRKFAEAGQKPTVPQLKAKCAHRYAELKELTLNTLIGWYWTIGAGLALGMKANEGEAKRRLEEVNKRTYPTQAQFTSYLKLTGQTVPDMLFRSKVQLFEVKINEKLTAMEKQLPKGLTAQQQQSALAKFTESLPPGKQWAAKTTCHKGYVVSACKEYRGSNSPGLPN
jgi:hypothetical protein